MNTQNAVTQFWCLGCENPFVMVGMKAGDLVVCPHCSGNKVKIRWLTFNPSNEVFKIDYENAEVWGGKK